MGQSTWGQKKLKKMMKLLCLLLALTSLVITAPSCKTSAMCQACDATTADKCTGCYNKGNDTTFNARALATNVCHSDGASFTPYCGMCASGKMGTEASNVTGLGSVNCIDGTITNCLFYQVIDATASLNNCYSCGTGYAVASTLLTCAAYTTDTNCRVLL